MKTAYEYNDGGRAAAGFKGHTGDCAVRAIAIATGRPYRDVYTDLFVRAIRRNENRVAKGKRTSNASPRTGVHKDVIRQYLKDLGWVWTPTMGIGTGCKVHLKADELPTGKLVCQVSKHIVAVIDGVVHDTYDSTRYGERCVYGYWSKA